MMQRPQKIELLAPAGNWECARAAVENGADAIYFGLDVGFNARARAANFHLEQLHDLMSMLHRQAVRGYVTLNTLVFTDELPHLERNVRLLADAGVDAVLVQDLGVVRMIRELCPALTIHASTQMTLTNASAIEMVRQLGVERVVLARELSIAEIRKISADTTMPIEVFVHGALCVAYSGQCLTSESLGGRSANRGQCAQACRLPYDIYSDGKKQELGDVKYLLSPQDLAAHDLVPQLLEAGICSLKIEGRLKTPEYVANVCAQYRAAIDEALAQRARLLTPEQRNELELSFSRGFSPGWLEGCDHKRLVPALSSTKRGVMLGEIVASRGDSITVQLTACLATGDGIVLQGDRFAGTEIGGRVYELFQEGTKVDTVQSGVVTIGLQRGSLNGKAVPAGLKVWKTDDPKLTKRLRQSFEAADPRKRVPVDLDVQIVCGEPIRLRAQVADTDHIDLVSEHIAEEARKHPISQDTLQEQFSRLGSTVYRLGKLSVALEGQPMVPLSVLGILRRELIAKLEAIPPTKSHDCLPEPVAARMLSQVGRSISKPNMVSTPNTISTPNTATPTLRVLCRTLEQLGGVLQANVKHVIADFHDIRQYRQAVALSLAAGATIELATLRIHKPGEDGLFHALAKQNADGWLVRNLAAMQYCIDHAIPMACDFSMNVTNPLTAQQLWHWGASRVTASYDLNRDQLCELAEKIPTEDLEVVIHQHMPMFHMEHCVYCSVLSPGKSKSDCGRPCDRHDVKLSDRVGAMHVLHADIGCRNTLYNGMAQSGAEAVAPLIHLGIRNFRIELLRDAPHGEIAELIGLYRDLITSKITGTEVWQKLKVHNRVGVTRGTLEQPRNPLAIL